MIVDSYDSEYHKYSLDDLYKRAFPAYEYQVLAAGLMGWMGFYVHLSNFAVRKPHESSTTYQFQKDIKVSLDPDLPLKYWIPIEIKGRLLVFGETDDGEIIKFPYTTADLYNVRKGSNSIPTLVFSTYTKDFLCFCDDGSQRTVKKQKDRKRPGNEELVYEVPIELAVSLDKFCDHMGAMLLANNK